MTDKVRVTFPADAQLVCRRRAAPFNWSIRCKINGTHTFFGTVNLGSDHARFMIDTLHASAFGRMPDVGAATMRIMVLARDVLGRP